MYDQENTAKGACFLFPAIAVLFIRLAMIGNYSFIVGCNDAQHIWEAGVCFCNVNSDVQAIL